MELSQFIPIQNILGSILAPRPKDRQKREVKEQKNLHKKLGRTQYSCFFGKFQNVFYPPRNPRDFLPTASVVFFSRLEWLLSDSLEWPLVCCDVFRMPFRTSFVLRAFLLWPIFPPLLRFLPLAPVIAYSSHSLFTFRGFFLTGQGVRQPPS